MKIFFTKIFIANLRSLICISEYLYARVNSFSAILFRNIRQKWSIDYIDNKDEVTVSSWNNWK